VVGGLFDSSSSPTAPQVESTGYGGIIETPGGPHSALQFGQREAERVVTEGQARQAAYNQQGQDALLRGQNLGGQAQLNAWLGQQSAAEQQGRSNAYQSQAIGTANQFGGLSAEERAQQQSALARLQGFYQQGPGPSAAEAQMQAGSDTNMAQAIALARSGRGVGGNAAAMRQAQFGNQAAGQQLNQQLGVLRANEAANWRNQQLSAMGLEQNSLAGMRGQDINAMGQAYGFAGQMGAQGLGYGQLGLGYQQAGNQAQLGFENMGNQTNLGFAGLGEHAGEFGETMRNKIFNDTTSWNMQNQIANANLQAGNAALVQKNDAADTAFMGSMLTGAAGMIGRGGGGGGGSPPPSESNPWSDERTKKNIHSVEGYVSSPPEAKRDIRPVSTADAPSDYSQQWGGVSLRDALFPPERTASAAPIVPGRGVDLRPAEGFSYEYKEPEAPGAAPGRHIGPMTRDLKKTPAGASVVRTDPRSGMEAVDTNRLSLVNTAAISEQQRRVDRIEKLLAELHSERPSFDTGALDASYGRQAADTGARFVRSDERSKKDFQPVTQMSRRPMLPQLPASESDLFAPTSAQLARSGERPIQELLYESEDESDDARPIERTTKEKPRRLGREKELAPTGSGVTDARYRRGTY
jgi:hypothetical protein